MHLVHLYTGSKTSPSCHSHAFQSRHSLVCACLCVSFPASSFLVFCVALCAEHKSQSWHFAFVCTFDLNCPSTPLTNVEANTQTHTPTDTHTCKATLPTDSLTNRITFIHLLTILGLLHNNTRTCTMSLLHTYNIVCIRRCMCAFVSMCLLMWVIVSFVLTNHYLCTWRLDWDTVGFDLIFPMVSISFAFSQ